MCGRYLILATSVMGHFLESSKMLYRLLSAMSLMGWSYTYPRVPNDGDGKGPRNSVPEYTQLGISFVSPFPYRAAP